MSDTTAILTLADKHGLPADLLLSVLPPDVPTDRLSEAKLIPGRGKAPAFYEVLSKKWHGMGQWTRGQVAAERERNAQQGSNFGLLLGKPSNGIQFAFFDVDTREGEPKGEALQMAHDIRTAVIQVIKDYLKGPIWVRNTSPWRAGILFVMPETALSGKKSGVAMFDSSAAKLGNLEILTKGQQVVIAGTHRKAGPITWYRTDEPLNLYALPKVDDALPIAFDGITTLQNVMDAVVAHLSDRMGVLVSRDGRSDAREAYSANAPRPDTLAAPDADHLINIFTKLEHDSYRLGGRGVWLQLHFAVINTIQAMVDLSLISNVEITQVEDAFIDWSARWDNLEGQEWSRDLAEAKFRSEKENIAYINATLGYSFIMDCANRLGLREVIIAQAQEDFTADLGREPADLMKKYVTQVPVAEGDERAPGESEYYNKPTIGKYGQRRTQLSEVLTSDIHIADKFAKELGDTTIWLPSEKRWIVWNGVEDAWSDPNGSESVRVRLEDLLMKYVSDNAKDINTETVQARIQSASRLNAVESLLRSRFSRSPDQINLGKSILQTPGGAFDLRSGESLGWERQQRLVDTRRTRYKPVEGPTPLFDKVLRHVAMDDEEVVGWLWAYLGYLLLGQPKEHVFLIIHGPGKNGKSTVDDTMQHILGDYAAVIDRGVVLESGKADHKTGVADVRGKRLWSVSELQPGEKWNEAQIRSMTGGDVIKARRMNQNFMDIHPEGSFLITTNYLPSFHRIDEAIVRRVRVIHAKRTLEANERDLNIKDRIYVTEAGAILMRLIKEARKIYDNGFQLPPVPESMQQEARRYLQDMDQFYFWFKTECKPSNSLEDVVPLEVLKTRYAKFMKRAAEASGEDQEMVSLMSEGIFIANLRRMGVDTEDKHNVMFKNARGERVAKRVRFIIAAVPDALPPGQERAA